MDPHSVRYRGDGMTKTLGQIAYEGFEHAYGSINTDYATVDDGHHKGWEAAAQAVRREVTISCALAIVDLAENSQELRLCLGEMSADEISTLKAGLRVAAHRLRKSLPAAPVLPSEERSDEVDPANTSARLTQKAAE